MNSFRLITSYSPWLILACLAVGALYAWLLYNKKSPWPKQLNYALATLRFIVISFICFLLIGPLVRYISNTTLPPTIVLALDDSQSVALFSDSTTLKQTKGALQESIKALEEAGHKVEVASLGVGTVTDLNQQQFSHESTNLNKLLSDVQQGYQDQNLAAVVLVSDGIVNQGTSPAYSNYSYPIYALALGDTIPKKDVLIASLRYNKVNYSGNRFPLEVELQQDGLGGQQAEVVIKENGKTITLKRVTLAADKPVQQVTFQVLASGLGKRHYEVNIKPIAGEFTALNNTKHAYIDVVKGKIKVLLAAAAPHPDIKAIRAAIETNENYEAEVYIPGIFEFKPQVFDVAILHQIPSRVPGSQSVLNLVKQKNIPSLLILGPQSDLNGFNQLQAGVTVKSGGQTDEVLPVLNPAFNSFRFTDNTAEKLEQYPPARVPYGDYILRSNSEVVLYQKVGSIRTNKPLLVVQNSDTKRVATLLASGIWQWRLIENANFEQSETFDRLITNLVQLLSAPRNKKRLNVYPAQTEYTSSYEIRFNAETYNEALEPTYGQNINLSIKNEAGETKSFSFVNGENQAGVNIGTLPGGRYTYTASASLNGKLQQDKGEFIVEELQLEALSAIADHQLLYQLAQNSGAKLYYPNQVEQLTQDLINADYKSKIYSSEELKDIIDIKWLFFLLLGLITAEWFIRKYNGSY